MKAPDMVERWMLRSAEQIIERLLARSARTLGVPIKAEAPRQARDRYHTQYRRMCVRKAMKTV